MIGDNLATSEAKEEVIAILIAKKLTIEEAERVLDDAKATLKHARLDRVTRNSTSALL